MSVPGHAAAEDDERFLLAFESGTLAGDQFHHRDHVRAAWLCLRQGTHTASTLASPFARRVFVLP